MPSTEPKADLLLLIEAERRLALYVKALIDDTRRVIRSTENLCDASHERCRMARSLLGR